MIEDRLTKVEGFLDGFRSVPQLVLAAVGVMMGALGVILTIGIFSINSLSAQINGVGTRVDAIPGRIAEEFRAMRVESAAQTSAITTSITAARQFQPQVIVMPLSPSVPGGDDKAHRP